ncbi:MAG: hypothetical protein NVS2B3_04030 [Vulcanimicrobiaceae bacterium]
MAKHRTALAAVEALDLRPLAKSSRLRYGAFETRGVPAILVGVAAIVLAVGASKTAQRAATTLPETLREARLLWTTVRPGRPELPADLANGAGR